MEGSAEQAAGRVKEPLPNRQWLRARAAFTGALTLVVLWACISALSWPFQAKLFPLAVCVPTLCLCIVQTVRDIGTARHSVPVREPNWLAEMASDQAATSRQIV